MILQGAYHVRAMSDNPTIFLQHRAVLTEENKPMNFNWVQFDKGTFRDNNIFVVIATF